MGAEIRDKSSGGNRRRAESRLVVAVFEESRRCSGVSRALLGAGGKCGARERVDGRLSKGRQGGGDG